MVLSESVKNEVIQKQKNKCKRCEKQLKSPIWFYHKIGETYRLASGDGSVNPDTIIGLCYECHSVIKDREKMKKQFGTSGDGVHLVG